MFLGLYTCVLVYIGFSTKMYRGIFMLYMYDFMTFLSLFSAGSTYIHSGGVVRFDVRKGGVGTSSSAGGAAKDSATAADVIVVNVPRELRGRSEIIVFLSEKPVRGMS